MVSLATFPVSSYLGTELENNKTRFQVRIQSVHDEGDGGLTLLSSSDPSMVADRENNGRLMMSRLVEKRRRVKNSLVSKDLEVLWDDGYGTKSAKDYVDGAKEMIKPGDHSGPPCWFCPLECGKPLNGSPLLLFLPGIDGVGLGLTLHHKALGKAFEVRCLHIPVSDRTKFQGLVKFVEATVKNEYASSPNKPVYLVGDSFGGCLALAVGARNPKLDLVLILVNPATSFDRSALQPLIPILEAFPGGLHYNAFSHLLSFVIGDPVKIALADMDYLLPPWLQFGKLSDNLTSIVPGLSDLVASVITKDNLVWKLNLLKSAASYANSRLHAVKAEVLVLASGNDRVLPSVDEANRLKASLQNCRFLQFNDNGHTLLLEDGISLLTIIKATGKYRSSRRMDYVKDYLPPSMSEYNHAFGRILVTWWLLYASGPAFFSTLEDGKIVKGLAGVPNEGPVLLIGYHMLLGLDLIPLVEQFLREKRIYIRGLAHPEFFGEKLEFPQFSVFDWVKVMGAVPVTASNIFKLLSTKSHVLLFPGGIREAGHRKGEEYKIFWPDQPEFVRMAARFGATIVPFGSVGEDDMEEILLDSDELMKVPVLNDFISETKRNIAKIRDESEEEVARQEPLLPVIKPKVPPGRVYFLFGKPIETKGKEETLKERDGANQLYLHVKTEVERSISYLLKKREQDPYRNFVHRAVYRHLHHSPSPEAPALDPCNW